jgi:hypothetical protein
VRPEVSSWCRKESKVKEERVVAELLESGLIDWVPLYDVIWPSVVDEAELPDRELVMAVLKTLFAKDLMVPGDLARGFQDWPGSEDDWIDRAVNELDRIEGLPAGAGFWLRLTEHGGSVARLNKTPH